MLIIVLTFNWTNKMLTDGLNLLEGSSITNMCVAKGDSFPISPNEGEIFFLTNPDPMIYGELYSYSKGSWIKVSYNDHTVTIDSVINITGAVIGSGTVSGVINTQLNNVNPDIGSFNTVVVNQKGLVTSASNTVYSKPADTISLVGDITGTGSNSSGLTTTLKTVNSNIGTYNNVTVNGKGLVTGASQITYVLPTDTITLTGDITGTGSNSVGLVTSLKTVNSNVGTFAGINVNAKGLVTGAVAVTTLLGYGITDAISATAFTTHSSDNLLHLTTAQNTLLDTLTASSTELNYSTGVTSNIQTQLNGKMPLAGGTFTGNVIMSSGKTLTINDAPVSSTDAANKNYVDSRIAGLTWPDWSLTGDTVSVKTFTGAVTCVYTDGAYVAATVTGATTLDINSVPDATKAYGMTFELTNAGTNVTWPASVTWLGTAPTLRASGVSMVTLITRNGGTTWYGSAA